MATTVVEGTGIVEVVVAIATAEAAPLSPAGAAEAGTSRCGAVAIAPMIPMPSSAARGAPNQSAIRPGSGNAPKERHLDRASGVGVPGMGGGPPLGLKNGLADVEQILKIAHRWLGTAGGLRTHECQIACAIVVPAA